MKTENHRKYADITPAEAREFGNRASGQGCAMSMSDMDRYRSIRKGY